jgi:hypothetical protein
VNEEVFTKRRFACWSKYRYLWQHDAISKLPAMGMWMSAIILTLPRVQYFKVRTATERVSPINYISSFLVLLYSRPLALITTLTYWQALGPSGQSAKTCLFVVVKKSTSQTLHHRLPCCFVGYFPERKEAALSVGLPYSPPR